MLIVLVGTNLAFADKYIPWSDLQKLTLDDFEGDVGRYPENYKMSNETDLAFTWGYPKLLDYNFTRINSVICQVQITDVNAIGMFDKEASWVKNSQKDNFKLLNHEQRHFDIIEIYARQIETNILFQIIECPHGYFDEPQIHNEIRLQTSEIGNRQQKMNDDYELEIKNGISTQDDWDLKIDTLLIQGQVIPTFHKELPPLVQIKNGIELKDVTCTQGWILVKNINDKPACVTPAVAKMLENRGWGTALTD